MAILPILVVLIAYSGEVIDQEGSFMGGVECITEDGYVQCTVGAESEVTQITVSGYEPDNEWSVFVSLLEIVRSEPLESKFRQQLTKDLSSVPGVSAVEEEDREVYRVSGNAKGKDLALAAAKTLDLLRKDIDLFIREEFASF